MELKCKIQNYDWGKRGLNSKVAVLYKNSNQTFQVEENVPYAELWMGTHPNGPSVLRKDDTPLSTLIDENPNFLGQKVVKYFGNQLPFLFKVLSVNTALSIQAHPSKEHAEKLHKERPDLYKDPNHKPELAIALTAFEALCGFRPLSEIVFFLKENQDLQSLIGQCEVDKFVKSADANGLKSCFTALMHSSQDKISTHLANMLERFAQFDQQQRMLHLAPLVERLNSQYPNDVGCFAVYFLNFLTLKPMEALYLGPNEPHAYLSGDCIECMACSDNVVRAGLTPKYIDKDTLCNMLVYKGEQPTDKLFKPKDENKFTSLFLPPIADFAVAKVEVPRSVKEYTLVPRASASIIIFISGAAKIQNVEVTSGTVLFIPADEKVHIENISCDVLLFQAMANVSRCDCIDKS